MKLGLVKTFDLLPLLQPSIFFINHSDITIL